MIKKIKNNKTVSTSQLLWIACMDNTSTLKLRRCLVLALEAAQKLAPKQEVLRHSLTYLAAMFSVANLINELN